MESELYTPKHLKKWKLPQYYYGEEWPEYYVFLGRNRDSDNLENSNFDCGLKEIGGESETVIVVCENHWLVGWVEWVAIHESDNTALMLADDIAERLTDYPLVNEDDYSQREWNDFTANCERAVRHYCQDNHKRFTWKLVKAVEDNSNDCSSETWPSENEIAEIYASL